MELIIYSKCSTCKKAKNYLDNKNIKYNLREIKEFTPAKEEITKWLEKYNIDINKLFNTSGLIYRELNLKDKLKNMTTKDKINLLSQNAMLIKRPILVCDNNLLVGFKEKEWQNINDK